VKRALREDLMNKATSVTEMMEARRMIVATAFISGVKPNLIDV
jgi:hypothetical protein